MEPITVLSDGSRRIAYENMIPLFEEWIADLPSDSERKDQEDLESWGHSRYCIVDYKDAQQAVSAANAIRAFMPQIPLLILTDFQSLIRKRHLQQITGTGLIKMILWNEHESHKLVMDIQKYLHPSVYQTAIAMPSTLSIR